MSDSDKSKEIVEAIELVEHPAINVTLAKLGMVKDVAVSEENEVSLTLVLPFPNIPDNVRDNMVNGLAAAVQSAGGNLTQASVAVMDDAERQVFLELEQQNWKG